jgi:3-oxoisoapionate decarboxylase
MNSSALHVGLGAYGVAWLLSPATRGLTARGPDPGGAEYSLPLTIVDLVRLAADFGFRRLQLADNTPVDALSATEWGEVLRVADERQVALEMGMRGLREEAVQQHLDRAVDAGSPFLRIVIDQSEFEPEPAEIVRLLRRLVPALAERRVVLAIENHDRFPARELAAMLEAVDSPWLGICLDTVNSLGAGEGVETVVAVLAPHVVNVHLKEFVVRRAAFQGGFVVEGAPLGAGWLKESRVRSVLAQLPRCRSVTLEQWVPAQRDIAATVAAELRWCAEGVRTLRTWFPEADWAPVGGSSSEPDESRPSR